MSSILTIFWSRSLSRISVDLLCMDSPLSYFEKAFIPPPNNLAASFYVMSFLFLICLISLDVSKCSTLLLKSAISLSVVFVSSGDKNASPQ